MIIPQLIRLSYGVQRISKEEQPVHVYSVGRYLGRDSSSHGFSSDEHSIRLVHAVLCLLNDRTVASLQDLSSVGHSSSCFHVWKVELDCYEAPLCEFCVEVSYEGCMHWSTGTVGYDEACRWITDLGGQTVDNAGLSASCQLDLHLL